VAAMVVGPEYKAIIGVALGISRRDRGAVRDGLFALLRGFLAAIAVTLLFGLAVRGRARPQPVPGRRPPGRPTSSTHPTCSPPSSPCWPGSWAWCP
jgi:hypothetical protein